ncbi:MAG: hypothetical protein WAU89_23400 [Candidatus Acidiferrales bacterium]
MATETKELQQCADCSKRFPVEQRKGARDGRWLCPDCFNEKHGKGLASEAGEGGSLKAEDPFKHKIGGAPKPAA